MLLYDDNGGHQGMTAAELIANAGAKLELVSPERFFAPEMGGMNHVPYMRAFHEKGVTHHHQHAAAGGAARGQPAGRDPVAPTFADGWREERRVDQVVVEHGTLPLDDLYLALKPLSKQRRRGRLRAAGRGRRHLSRERNPTAAFTLLRIGDAVAARNIHAAIYDGIRFALRI